MPDLNIFKIDFQNLVKLSQKGRIISVYRRMYKEAEKLSNKEFDLFLRQEAIIKRESDVKTWFELIMKYRKDRIDFHMN
jgi:hypothetical protein